jgi:hypothetical protein
MACSRENFTYFCILRQRTVALMYKSKELVATEDRHYQRLYVQSGIYGSAL